MNRHQSKPCEVCGKTFTPDHRVGDRQRVCRTLSCQRERKRRSQKRWNKHNPTYFQGRYPQTKAWLEEHPAYLKRYRARLKTDIRTQATDIQDELTTNLINEIDAYALTRLRDIQDKITHYINKCFSGVQLASPLIYKTS